MQDRSGNASVKALNETCYAESSYGTKWERLPKIHLYFHNTVLTDLSLSEDHLYCRVRYSSLSDFTTDGLCASFLQFSELHIYILRDRFHCLKV